MLEARLLGRNDKSRARPKNPAGPYVLSSLRNTIVQGDSEEILQEFPAGSVNLIFVLTFTGCFQLLAGFLAVSRFSCQRERRG